MQSAMILFDSVVTLLIWAVILSAVMSWLIALNIFNFNNKIVYVIASGLNRLTEPFLNPIRRWMPNLGGLDLSPVVVILLLIFFRNLVFEYFYY